MSYVCRIKHKLWSRKNYSTMIYRNWRLSLKPFRILHDLPSFSISPKQNPVFQVIYRIICRSAGQLYRSIWKNWKILGWFMVRSTDLKWTIVFVRHKYIPVLQSLISFLSLSEPVKYIVKRNKQTYYTSRSFSGFGFNSTDKKEKSTCHFKRLTDKF